MAGDLESACTSGVYLISPEQRQRMLAQDGSLGGETLIVMSGGDVSGREAFFAAMARAVPFPCYFGHNWDAVYDCLTDPSVIPADGVVLLLDGFDPLAIGEPEQWRIALNVLRDACAFWRPLSREMIVLLAGTSELAPGVLPLPARCLDA